MREIVLRVVIRTTPIVDSAEAFQHTGLTVATLENTSAATAKRQVEDALHDVQIKLGKNKIATLITAEEI